MLAAVLSAAWPAVSLADPALKANLKIVLAAVTQDGRILKYVRSTFKANPNVVLVTVTQDAAPLNMQTRRCGQTQN